LNTPTDNVCSICEALLTEEEIAPDLAYKKIVGDLENKINAFASIS